MPRWRPESLLLAKVVAIVLPLAVVLWLAPLVLLDHQHRQAGAQRAGEAAALATTAQVLAQARLHAVAEVLAAAQRDAGPPQGAATLPEGLIRSLLVLRRGEERSFLTADAVAAPSLPLLFGAPRAAAGEDWVLPVLRPAMAEDERPALAALDPRRLLALPLPEGADLLLVSGDGQVLAAAGQELGRIGPRPGRAALEHGLMVAEAQLGDSGLTVLARLPAPSAGHVLLLAGLGLLGAALLGSGAVLLRRHLRLREALPANPGYSQRQLAEVLGALDQGACLLDSQLRLVAWNPRFPALAGVTPQVLRPGLDAAAVAAAEDQRPESAIRAALRHRLSDMQHRRSGCVIRFRPDGSQVEDRWTTLEEGGLLLTSRLLTEPAALPPPCPPHLAALCAEELRKRLPLLLDAIAAGDFASARMEAHAMKGVAANFGLPELAESLAAVESAARAQQLANLRGAAPGLAPQLESALEALFSRAA